MNNSFEKSNPRKKNDIREKFLLEPVGKLMIKNILPSVGAMIMMGLYGIVDGILIGRRLGAGPMASINLLFPILSLTIGLATMVGVGGNTKVAVLLGKGETNRAKGVFSVVMILGVFIGVATSLAIYLNFNDILSVLGSDKVLGEYAAEYLRGLYLFFTPIIIFFILERSVRNDGKPNLATCVMIFTSILNIFLDYIFLFPFNMGLIGAAIATGVSQSVGGSVFIGYFIYKRIKKLSGLSFGSTRGCWKEVLGVIGNGSSELFGGLAVGITTLIYNRQILYYAGTSGLAAFVLVQYFLILASQIFIGISTGAQPILSYNYGGNLLERVQGVLVRVMGIGIIVSIIFFIGIRWQTENLVRIFIVEDLETIALAIEVSNYMSWSFLFMSIGILGSAYFTALEQATKSLIISLLRGLILILLGLTLFPIIWGANGIWFTSVFAEGVTGIIAIVFIMKRPIKENEYE